MPKRLRYPELAPEGFNALIAFGHYISTASTLEPSLKGLVDLRASQINNCHFCIAMHKAELRKHHEPQSRIDSLATWRTSTDIFTPREQAALAWTETLTNLPTSSHASDEDYAAVSAFFHDKDLVDLTYAIANINAWNRLGVAFQPEWKPTPKPEPEQAPDDAKVSED